MRLISWTLRSGSEQYVGVHVFYVSICAQVSLCPLVHVLVSFGLLCPCVCGLLCLDAFVFTFPSELGHHLFTSQMPMSYNRVSFESMSPYSRVDASVTCSCFSNLQLVP